MVYQTNSRQDTLIKKKGEFLDESEQSVIASIKMLGANIEHSARNNYRPYMMLYGEVAAVAFPNGTFQSFVPQTQVHVRYEFSDSELATLAEKGLFYDGFRIPEIISENPNIEIPMTATARRYALMDNLYVTLDLAAADIYKTNTDECGYVFADYFETQIPSKLDTRAIEQEIDAIPSFDEDFAKQFEEDFKESEDALEAANDEFNKISAQEKHKQSLITAEAQKLLESSPTAKREREKAEAIGRKIAADKEMDKNTSPESNILEDDAEFEAFRRAQEEFSTATKPKPVIPPYDNNEQQGNNNDDLSEMSDTSDDAEFDAWKEEKEEEKEEDLSTTSDVSVSVKVDGQENDDEESPNFGDAFEGMFDDMFEDVKSKSDVEKILENMSTKQNHQTLNKPEEDALSKGMDYDTV